MKCIYCLKQHNSKSIEHVIPEAIGCPENAILQNGEVCSKCNNELGHNIDMHLKDAFDFLLFNCNISRKKHRFPVVASRGNLFAEYINGKPNVYFNTGNKSVLTGSQKKLVAYNPSNKRHVKIDYYRNGNEINFNFSVTIGEDIRFTRAIFKIALGSLTLQKGIDETLNQEYNNIRSFILTGSPVLYCIATSDEKPIVQNILYPLWEKEHHFIVPIRLLGMDFLCDISQGQLLYPEIFNQFKKFKGNTGWTYYPIKS
jgi:hypothetical protein